MVSIPSPATLLSFPFCCLAFDMQQQKTVLYTKIIMSTFIFNMQKNLPAGRQASTRFFALEKLYQFLNYFVTVQQISMPGHLIYQKIRLS